MQAIRKFLPILLVVVVVLVVVAACNGGGGGRGQTWFNLPSTPITIDANGNASIYGIGLGQVMTPDQVQLVQSLGQRVEVRIGHNGVHVYINGEDHPYLAWDDESAANLERLLAQIPATAPAAQAVPWLRRIGLGAALNVPPVGPPLNIPRWRGETAASPQQPTNQMAPLSLGVSFDQSGKGSIGPISGDLLASLTGGANPLQLDPGTLAQITGLGLQNLSIKTTPGGLEVTVNGARMPGLAYDANSLSRLGNLLPALPGIDEATANLVGGVVDQLPNMNLGLNVDFTGQPVEFKLPELPIKVGEGGALELLGLSLPGLALPEETLQPLRDLGVEQLALNASTEEVNIAIDGQTLPRIRFGPNGLNTLLGALGPQTGLPAPVLTTLTDALLKDGISTRIALSGDLADVAAPGEPSFAPANLGNTPAPVIRLNAVVQNGRIVSVGGLSAEALAALGVELPTLPPDVMKILGDLSARTVDIVNTPNNLSIQINGSELLSIDYDAASLSTVLDLAGPYLAGTPLEDPAVMKLVQDVILPIAPAADLKVQLTIQ